MRQHFKTDISEHKIDFSIDLNEFFGTKLLDYDYGKAGYIEWYLDYDFKDYGVRSSTPELKKVLIEIDFTLNVEELQQSEIDAITSKCLTFELSPDNTTLISTMCIDSTKGDWVLNCLLENKYGAIVPNEIEILKNEITVS